MQEAPPEKGWRRFEKREKSGDKGGGEICQGWLREMGNDGKKSCGELGEELGKDLGGENLYLVSQRTR